MIRHLLLLSFNQDVPASDISHVENAFQQLPDTVAGVLSVEWGMNNSAENKNAGYTHCVLMTFLDSAALQGYLPHPEHLRLKTLFRPLVRDIIVLDYSLKD